MMSDVGAAIGIIQLKKLQYFIKRRREIASIYREKLYDEMIANPLEREERKHVYSRYVVRTPYNPSGIIEKMREQSIICERMYVPPLHKRALIRRFNSDARFPKTEEILDSAISLPIYPSLDDERVEYVADAFMSCVKRL